MAEVAGQGMGGDGLQVRQCHAVIDVVTEKEFDSMRRKMKNASIELLENEKGVGIINACLRLKMMSHDRVQFELNGEEGTGVSVLIRLPFIESEKG